jgi:hypothetical protein
LAVVLLARRARFIERRIPGLYDDVRPGKPRSIETGPTNDAPQVRNAPQSAVEFDTLEPRSTWRDEGLQSSGTGLTRATGAVELTAICCH